MMGSPWAQRAPQFDPSSLLAGLGQSSPQDGLTRAMNNPPDAMAAAMNRAPSPLDQPASGMFAARRPGVDWGQLGAMILAANGNPLGTMTLQQHAQQQQAQAALRQRMLEHAQEQQDIMSRETAMVDYRRAHPEPDEFTRTLAAAGIDPASPEAAGLYRQRAQSLAQVMQVQDVHHPDGSVTREQIVVPSAGAASPIPLNPDGSLPPGFSTTPPAQGGPSASASRAGFPG